jgi:pimeloyl-ACP methyl ester carboxylesterase
MAQMASIARPALVISGNHDVGSLEHAVAMAKILPKGRLAVFPGGHGTYLGSLESLENGVWPRFNATELIREFLDGK